MIEDQENKLDGIADLILSAALGVEGVEGATVDRTEEGYHLKVFPKPGVQIEVLRKAISAAEEKCIPLLASEIQSTIIHDEHTVSVTSSKTRIELVSANDSTLQGGRFNISVRLQRASISSNESNEAEGNRGGAYLTDNVIRLSAEATLDAILMLTPEIRDGAVIGTKRHEIGDTTIIVVLLTLILHEGKIHVSGSACVKEKVCLAAVNATRRAVNRFLEFAEEG